MKSCDCFDHDFMQCMRASTPCSPCSRPVLRAVRRVPRRGHPRVLLRRLPAGALLPLPAAGVRRAARVSVRARLPAGRRAARGGPARRLHAAVRVGLRRPLPQRRPVLDRRRRPPGVLVSRAVPRAPLRRRPLPGELQRRRQR